ncbi:MAG: hypothetical protein ACRDCF_02400 [Mycoplasmoidaceae bacterium]
MKKKIIISSLLIGSTLSILPLNFIFNNKNYQEQKIENENINENEEISNITKVDTKNGPLDALYDKNYTSIFTNNFTNPVVSPNKDTPGFLGAWDTNSVGSFPTAIGWTTHNLFLSWSANLIDHPSLEGKVPSNFKPGLVTALHSDNKYSTEKRNQIFAIVANTANLSAREYWILRYNALDGSPIKDDDAKMPQMQFSPIPKMDADNGNGSAFALTNDTINDRYIAFYPGRLVDLKTDIFGFKINNENKIEWLRNDPHFQGWRTWPVVSDDYNGENFVLGLAPFNTKNSTVGDASLALMLAIRPSQTTDPNKYYFRILNLKNNFAPVPGFRTKNISGRTDGVFNSTQGTIAVPKELLTLQIIQKNVNPNLQLFTYIDQQGIPNYKAQIVVPVLRNNEWIYMYLSGIFDKFGNTYYDSWGGGGTLGQGSFFSSRVVGSNPMPPNISYSEENPNEILITHQENSTDDRRFSATRFVFDTKPPNNPWNPTSEIVNSLYNINSNSSWGPKNVIIKNPYVENNYIWSLPNGLTEQYIYKPGQRTVLWAKITSGGIKHEDFQKTASSLKWLKGQSDQRIPTAITSKELETIGTSSNDFFKIPDLSYLSGATSEPPTIKLFGEPTRDNRNGIIQGVFTLTQKFMISGEQYEFESKIPFKITGLNTTSDSPTTISPNNLISNFLPSDLTPENVPNLMDIVGAPDDYSVDKWEITKQNNAAGTATISTEITSYYDDAGIPQPGTRRISADVSGFKKLNGTTAIASSEINPDLTVWEINPTNASSFVEIKDLILGSNTNNITYLVRDEKPLTGELTIDVSIPGGSYYNPKNNGLPSIAADDPLILSVNVTGFKKIPDTGTLIIPGTGPYPGVWPGFINEDNIMDFITIENQVPGSKASFSNFEVNPPTLDETLDGYLDFDIVFDKEYDTYGNIINGAKKTYRIKGLQSSPTPLYTKIASTGNTDLFSNTLAPEINETNINQFIILVNLPPGVTPIYEFKNQKNTGEPKTGFLDINVVVSKYLDEEGNIVNNKQDFPIRIEGLKTIPAATSVSVLSGEKDVLPEFVSQVGLEKYLRINNPSLISGKESSIQVNTEKFTTNNIIGTISFEYKLINAITDFGFIEQSGSIPITISGFQKGTTTSIKQVSTFKDKKASEFDLNIDNFFNYAKIEGYFIPQNTDDEGNISGTIIEKVEKIRYDDALGLAIFKVSVKGGAINTEGRFTNESLDITFNFDGFQIVSPVDNTIPIIAGSVAGGVVLIILIVVAIVLINNNKNKKILNEKRKTTTPGGPPVTPGTTNSVSPSRTTSIPTPSMSPGTARPSVPQPTTGVPRPTPPRPGTPPPVPPKK